MLERISYSALRDYLKCPLLYWYRHAMRIKFPYKPIPLAFGSALHIALEQYYLNKKSKPLKIFEKNFKFGELYFKDSVVDQQLDFEEKTENGKRLLTYFLENHEDHFENITDAEEKFKFRLKNPATGKESKLVQYVTGITDYCKNDNSIGDYKTSSKKYKQDDIDESLQPTFYYLWYFNKFRKLPSYFEYIIFLKKHKKVPIQIMQTERTMDDIVSLFHLIEKQSKLIQKELFPRAIHSKYDYCDCKLYDSVISL